MIKYIKISLSKEHSKQEEDILFLGSRLVK